MTTEWLKHTGLKSGMTLAETLASTPGEIMDMAACEAIDNGAQQKNKMSFDDTLKVR